VAGDTPAFSAISASPLISTQFRKFLQSNRKDNP